MRGTRYKDIVPIAYGTMVGNRNGSPRSRRGTCGSRDQGALPAYLLDDLGYRIYKSAMNLLCVPAERSDLAVAGATEITFDLLRANFELS